MSGFKRLCLVVFSIAGIFSLAALSLTWFGPWCDVASSLFAIEWYTVAVAVCLIITLIGLVVMLLLGIFYRKVKTVEITNVDDGLITVSLDAIASEAAHIVEEDGTCKAKRVRVKARKKGHVRVYVKVLPYKAVDVVAKGAELHDELVYGLAAVCGDKLTKVSLEFEEPESMERSEAFVNSSYAEDEEEPEDDTEETTVTSTSRIERYDLSGAQATAVLNDDIAEPASISETESSGEIRIPMGNSHDTEREA